ncbi:DEAD/DEAH box helicase family protein [Plantactinospora soyae]
MSDGGGLGISTTPVLQFISQARSEWGLNVATTILGDGPVAEDLRADCHG